MKKVPAWIASLVIMGVACASCGGDRVSTAGLSGQNPVPGPGLAAPLGAVPIRDDQMAIINRVIADTLLEDNPLGLARRDVEALDKLPPRAEAAIRSWEARRLVDARQFYSDGNAAGMEAIAKAAATRARSERPGDVRLSGTIERVHVVSAVATSDGELLDVMVHVKTSSIDFDLPKGSRITEYDVTWRYQIVIHPDRKVSFDSRPADWSELTPVPLPPVGDAKKPPADETPPPSVKPGGSNGAPSNTKPTVPN
jgi:hypothetical protein